MRIEAVVGDITTEKVDAIVNAANSALLGGGGVDGAIHRAAGPSLLDACQKVRDTELPDGLPVGRAMATPGFDLPAAWVIHTVGPNRHAGEDDPALLRACFDSSLELAIQLGCTGIALPAVSAGVYGWPIAEVAEVAVARAAPSSSAPTPIPTPSAAWGSSASFCPHKPTTRPSPASSRSPRPEAAGLRRPRPPQPPAHPPTGPSPRRGSRPPAGPGRRPACNRRPAPPSRPAAWRRRGCSWGRRHHSGEQDDDLHPASQQFPYPSQHLLRVGVVQVADEDEHRVRGLRDRLPAVLDGR